MLEDFVNINKGWVDLPQPYKLLVINDKLTSFVQMINKCSGKPRARLR